MKLKAVVNVGCPEDLVIALNNIRGRILVEVLERHLRVKPGSFGPAEFYVQNCDFAVSEEPFCEVRLTGISVSPARAADDFRNARNELEKIYAEVIHQHLLQGQKMQLFISVMADRSLPDGSPSLVEGNAIWVGTI